MTFHDIPLFMTEFFDFLDSPMWRAWPFNAGYGEHILPSIARLAFVSLIFAAIILFLRVMFGPKGFFRDEEMDRDAEEIYLREEAELKEQLKNGKLTEAEFAIKMRGVRS